MYVFELFFNTEVLNMIRIENRLRLIILQIYSDSLGLMRIENFIQMEYSN